MNSYSIWTKLDRFPPVLVRLLATYPHDRNVLMADESILLRSNGALRPTDIKRLSYAASWDGIPVDMMKSFCLACDVDFADPKRMKTLTKYLKGSPKWVHLRRHPNYAEFRRMLAQLFQ